MLSQKSLEILASKLAPDFVEYLNETYADEISTLLVEATNSYIADTFDGELDVDVAAQLGCELSCYVKIVAINGFFLAF